MHSRSWSGAAAAASERRRQQQQQSRRRLLLPATTPPTALRALALLLLGGLLGASSVAAVARPAAAAFMSPARLLIRGGYGLLRRGASATAAAAAAARTTGARGPLLMLATAAASGLGSSSQPQQQGGGGRECAAPKPPCARVVPVPILSDNYAYLVIDPKTGVTACVDPAEPEKLLAAAKNEGVSISTLLCTHKHWDHAGGNEAMAASIPGLQVVTTKYEEIPAATTLLGDDEAFTLGSLRVRALYTPCHTRGHVLFYVTGARGTAPVLFSGDTLFVGGCGRFFEGDGAQMVEALLGRVAKLPPETLVYCGHEYTKSNLKFAAHVEPDNAALQAKIAWADRTLASGGYTVPSTVGEELAYNPFMRVTQASVVAAARAQGGAAGADPAAVMSALREMKNGF